MSSPARPPVLIPVRRLSHGAGIPLPTAASAGAAGLDLRAAVDTALEIPPAAWSAVPTGLVVEIPTGFEGQVRPRSGLARRHGLTLLNSPGTIDSDYRGEVQVLLVNLGSLPVTIERGERIAQLVIAPVQAATMVEVAETSPTSRGGGGFGSSGRH